MVFITKSILSIYLFISQIPEEDLKFAKDLQVSWGNLYQTTLFRAATLEKTKDKFSKMNVIEIANFLRELDEFVEKFDSVGPGTVGDEMDRGLLLMEVKYLLARYEKHKDNLHPSTNISKQYGKIKYRN